MEKAVPESKMDQGNQKGHRNGLRKRETTILRAQLRQQDICKRLQQTIEIPIVRGNRTRFSQHGLHVWPYRPHEVLVITYSFLYLIFPVNITFSTVLINDDTLSPAINSTISK